MSYTDFGDYSIDYEIDPIYQYYYTPDFVYNFGFSNTLGELQANENTEMKDMKLRDLMDKNLTAGKKESALETLNTRGNKITNEFMYPRTVGGGGKRAATLTLKGPNRKKLRFSVSPLMTS